LYCLYFVTQLTTLVLVWTVIMFTDFGEALCYLLLAMLADYSSIEIGWKKADLHHDGGST